MATSPLSNWSSGLDKCRDTFANLSAFRDWCTLPSQTQVSVAFAKTRVHIESRPKPHIAWPFLIIMPMGVSYTHQDGAFIRFDAAELLFEMKNVESAGTPDEYYALTNPVGLILEELSEVSGRENTIGFISDPRSSLVHGPRWGSEGEQVTEGSVMFCKWTLTWGQPR